MHIGEHHKPYFLQPSHGEFLPGFQYPKEDKPHGHPAWPKDNLSYHDIFGQGKPFFYHHRAWQFLLYPEHAALWGLSPAFRCRENS